MRILLDNGGYDFLNQGDLAMLQVAVSRLRKLWPQADLHVITEAADRLAECFPGTLPLHLSCRLAWYQVKKLNFFPNRIYGHLPGFLSKKLRDFEDSAWMRWPSFSKRIARLKIQHRGLDTDLNLAMKFLSEVFNADLVVGTGGGYLNDTFRWHAYRVLDTLRMAADCGKPTALLGQGIGPVQDSKLKELMKSTLPKIDLISLREGRSGWPILLKHGVKPSQVIITGDDAIELAYRMRSDGLGMGIGVNLRLTDYSEIDGGILEAVRSVFEEVAAKYRAPLVPVPISFDGGGEDNRAIRQIMSRSGRLSEARLTILRPDEIIEKIGGCRVVVAGSYHAGVFALSRGIPVVGLAKSQYYKEKFLGLADQFDKGCKVVFLDNGNFNETLRRAIENAWETAAEVKPALLEAADHQIKKGYAAYQRLFEIVEAKRACAN